MKKTAFAALCLIAALTLAACGAKKTPPVSVCIDGVTYTDTGKEIPVEPDESVIEYAEIPVGAGASITAFAKIDGGETLICLINNEWREFAERK